MAPPKLSTIRNLGVLGGQSKTVTLLFELELYLNRGQDAPNPGSRGAAPELVTRSHAPQPGRGQAGLQDSRSL